MAILDIAALGFLDLGAQLPSPEWGAMLGDSLELVRRRPLDGDAARRGNPGQRVAGKPQLGDGCAAQSIRGWNNAIT